MCEAQAEYIDDANDKELTGYCALVALSVSLFVTHALAPELLSSILSIFAKHTTHLQIPRAADEHLSTAFTNLHENHPEKAGTLSVPHLEAATHTRRLRTLYRLIEA
eukprot:TRINITY_DN2203_c1_g1_i1.p1 TRINITY_DN2203_c1_g1~~TRINITY_DN2203_c1_g1_i1.p1  ORF type:complete len:124 (+),score=44.44 TRINITY_DN2203_c1_g1_i1:53-373(+)